MEKAMVVRWGAVIGFVTGLFLFLIQTRNSGEALETLKIALEPGPLVLIGGGLMGVSLAIIAFTFRMVGRNHHNA